MIDRILKSWKTTLFGLLIVLVTLAMVFYDVATLTEVGAFWAIALVLIFSKDGQGRKE